MLGQGIVVIATPPGNDGLDTEALDRYCRETLPLYMVPGRFVERDSLPRTPNGKIDRKLLADEIADSFREASA